jgi:rubrerythrin
VGDLWTSLARDEHGHGALLRSLAEKSDDMTAFVENRRYDLAEVQADTARLRNLAQITPVAGFPLQEAFRAAVKLEDSLIESQIFAVYDGDPEEVTAVVDTLREQTERHQRRLSEKLKGLGG